MIRRDHAPEGAPDLGKGAETPMSQEQQQVSAGAAARPCVLISGGGGYIGSHVAWACVDAGLDVVIVDDLSNGFRRLAPKDARFEEACISDAALVSALVREHNVAAIMHFAGSVVVPDSVARPLDYYGNNTVNSWAFLKAAMEAGVDKVIFSSTAAVYGAKTGAGGDFTIAENAPTAPMSPYGWSKLMTEQMIRDAAAATGLNYAILRYFNVAGADPEGRTGQSAPNAEHLIKVANRTALGLREILPIFGDDYDTPDGTCVRDFIHVSDLADAHVLALKHLLAEGGQHLMNCGYGRGASVLDVVSALERITGRPLPTTREPRRPGDVPAIVADNSRLLETLPWRPRFEDLDAMVRSAYEWEVKLNEPAS